MAGSFGMVLFIYGNLETGRLQDEGGDGGAPGLGPLGLKVRTRTTMVLPIPLPGVKRTVPGVPQWEAGRPG